MGLTDNEAIWTRVRVCNPITHNTWDSGKYTTYEISIETNNPAFTLFKSCVRRRYSEFAWLKDILENYNGREKVPRLPSRNVLQLFHNRFDPAFIHLRMQGLEEFVNRLVSVNEFLSATATHLFLQSCVITEDIQRIIQGKCKANTLALIKETGTFHDQHRRKPKIDVEYQRFLGSSQFESYFSNRKRNHSQRNRSTSQVTYSSHTAQVVVDLENTADNDANNVNQFSGSNSLQFRHGAFCTDPEGGEQVPCVCSVPNDIAESSFSSSNKISTKKSVTFCNEVTVAKPK